MTNAKSSPRAFRSFENGHALTYTIREFHDADGEFQSQHHDLATAAEAFALACRQARCVELRGRDGSVLAEYVSDQQAGAS